MYRVTKRGIAARRFHFENWKWVRYNFIDEDDNPRIRQEAKKGKNYEWFNNKQDAEIYLSEINQGG